MTALPCHRLEAEAAGLAALPPGHPERAAAEVHARACPACAAALRRAERLQGLLAEAGPSPVPPALLARLSGAIAADLRREARRRAAATAGAALAVFLLLAALARHRSREAGDWIAAAVLALGASLLAALGVRRARFAIPAAAAAALGAAALAVRGGPLDAALGLRCALDEMAAAALVVGAMWLALRGGSTSPARSAWSAAAAAGALAGDAALQLACASSGELPHALVFHLGGVLAAAALGSLAGRRPAGDGRPG